jgi:transcriptional regulator with GAF, ATPase, and Fis domain
MLRAPRDWRVEDIREVRVLGELLANAAVRREATEELALRERALREAYAELERLKERLQEENLFLREEVRAAQGISGIIGESPKIRRALLALEKVAPTDATILLLGDTGTGKDLMAQAAHALSDRRDQTLISVNCATLSHSLIESELFGHERGAFTGAQKLRKGRFQLADGGTLFLDEIGELPLELQAKLLRVLQDGSFERLGGTQTMHVNTRIIAATNRNLQLAVDRGEFRADLYYRINSFPIELPSLRERPDDIPLLVEHLTRQHAARLGKEIESISARTIRYMKGRDWPGNIRELESYVVRALISCSGNVLDFVEGGAEPGTDENSSGLQGLDLRTAERNHIQSVLTKTRWKISGRDGAAAMLKIPESTLRSMMKRLQIRRPH